MRPGAHVKRPQKNEDKQRCMDDETMQRNFLYFSVHYDLEEIAACAAASLAIGTRKGEQLT